MKIKQLEFENINSLCGHWKIDFTDKIFDDFGRLFTISGPTGAGKTTILDAICLALYGKTPRQDAVNNNKNEVMTWGEKSCFAKVTFESNGKTYVSGWEQSYTRNKTLGDYKRSLFSIEDDGTERNLGSTKRNYNNQIIKIIGLDFDQFTQAVLLPQGDFARFLSGEVKERTQILEKLSGGEKYRLIAQKTHEHFREEENKLKNLQNELGNIEQKCLSDEDIEKIKSDIFAKGEELENIKCKQNKIIEQKQWRKNLEKISNDYKNAQSEYENAEIASKEFEPQREMLNLARNVTNLLPHFSVLKKNRETKVAKEIENEKLTQQFESLKKKATEIECEKNKASDFYVLTEKEKNDALPIWEDVLRLDEQVVSSKQRYNEAVNYEQNLRKQLQSIQYQINDVQKKLADLNNDETKDAEYLQSFADDEVLVENLEAWQERTKSFILQKEEIEKLRQNICRYEKELSAIKTEKEKALDTEKKLSEYQKNNAADKKLSLVFSGMQVEIEKIYEDLEQIAKSEYELEKLENDLKEGQINLDTAEYDFNNVQKKLEGLHVDEIGKISTFLRMCLKDGDDCPVCGGKYYGNTESSAELKNSVHVLVQHIESIQKEKEDTANNLARVKDALNEVRRNVEVCRRQHKDKTESVRNSLKKISLKLSDFGFSDLETEDFSSVAEKLDLAMKQLDKRKRAWEDSEEKLDIVNDILNEKNVNEKSLAENLAIKQAELNDKIVRFEKEWNDLCMILSVWQTEITMEDLADVMEMLKKRKASWHFHKENLNTIRQRIMQLQAELSEKNKNYSQCNEDLVDRSGAVKKAKSENENIYNERVKLFGTKNLKDEQRKLNEKLKTAKEKNDDCEFKFMQIQKQLNEIETKKESNSSDLKKIVDELQKIEADFQNRCRTAGFDSENAVENAAKIDREKLENAENEIKSRCDRANEALKICKKNFDEEEKRKLTEKSIEQLDVDFADCDKQMQNINTEISDFNHKLMSHYENTKTFGEKRKMLDEQKVRCDKWWKMKTLMGTADGKNFAQFVQSITLKQLIVEANLHLEKITKRYQLISDFAEDLKLYLIDRDLGNEKRSVSNLSGGEKFLVSLSLALGISSMASRKIKIDTLFLDEGFGTLDNQSLASTVNMLQAQQQESGKMLGIITHVETLKDEFPLRIEVKKKGQGISILEGPGISR